MSEKEAERETEKRPKRSGRVLPSLLAAAALAATLSGCSQTTTARCVDANGNVLPDSACGTGGTYVSGTGGYGGGYGGGGHWVYGGRGGTTVGSRATGYSASPPSNGNISSPSGTVVRGGFGGEGSSHGGGGEGGHGGGGGE